MQVTVLYGGPSAEREISLISGQAVIDGLKKAGHDVFPSDISPTDLAGLDHPHDVIFPVLHGEFGESGELQEILEQRKLPFVGSGSKASRLGMDKVLTKQAWEKAGLPTPPYFTQTRTSIEPHGMDKPLRALRGEGVRIRLVHRCLRLQKPRGRGEGCRFDS